MKDEKNILAQPDKFKWRENPPKVTPGEMRMAMMNARELTNFNAIVGIPNVLTSAIAGSALCTKCV